MKITRRFLSGFLTAVLLNSLIISASAAGFTRTRTYTAGMFTDVVSTDWYATNVKDCYEMGLMSGNDDGTFNPNGMFTVAEALTVTARMHNIYNGGNGTIPSASGDWWQGAVDYCLKNGIISSGQFDSYTRNATRAEMAALMVGALPDSAWNAINNVAALPDVSASTDAYSAIFKLYNAGILTGNDDYGTFQPYANITRAEVAAIAARCADTSQRKTFTLTPLSQREAPAIPGTISYSNYKMASGRMLYRDATTKLYGYISGAGEVSIPAMYTSATDFSSYGYAIVQLNSGYGLINTNNVQVIPATYYEIKNLGYGAYAAKMRGGQYCLIVNGVRRSDHIYSSITTNGVYIIGKISDVSWDIYDINGTKIGHFDGQPTAKTGSPLLAVKSGNKYALATGQKVITDYLYDSITLYENSSLAVLKYGTQYALAGENGVILNLGECTYTTVNGDYAAVQNSLGYAIADANGIRSDFVSNSFKHLLIGDSVIFGSYFGDGSSLRIVYDFVNAKSYTSFAQSNYGDGYVMLQDGTYILRDGVYCNNVVSVGSNYCTFQVNGKYGLAYKGAVVADPIYNSSDEAIAAYGFYKIDKENGKPVVVYGNSAGGFNTYGIRYYKNNIYYDEIREVGEGYYACKYNTTWYLVHA